MQNMWDFALPLAAILVPAFVAGFGAVWLGMQKGLGRMEATGCPRMAPDDW